MLIVLWKNSVGIGWINWIARELELSISLLKNGILNMVAWREW